MKRLLMVFAMMCALCSAAQASTIRVLFAYTPAALAYLSSAGIDGYFDSVMTETTASFTNSQIYGLNTVRAGDYSLSSQEVDMVTQWYATRNSIGALIARDFTNADVVVTVTYYGLSNDECGMANGWEMSPGNAFIVVDAACMLSTQTFQHELGHIMGGHHNIELDTGNYPYAQGHGYETSYYTIPSSVHVCFHDIMAYGKVYSPNNCTDQRINYWSNPNIWWPNPSVGNGTPTGEPTNANMALVVGALGPNLASYHLTKMYLDKLGAMAVALFVSIF